MKLDGEERIGLRLVVVGVAGLAVRDVVGDLKGTVAVDEGDVGEIVSPGRQRETGELTDRARVVMRRVEIGRIEARASSSAR